VTIVEVPVAKITGAGLLEATMGTQTELSLLTCQLAVKVIVAVAAVTLTRADVLLTLERTESPTLIEEPAITLPAKP